MKEIVVSDGNRYFSSVDGVLYNNDQSVLICYPGVGSGEYSVPESVKIIGDSSFRECYGFTKIIIPNSVITIGNNAFDCCGNLTSVYLSDGITSIGKDAFSLCKKLSNVVLPNSITSIGEGAFGCCQSLKSITIPNSVTEISAETFGACTNLNSVSLPDSITSIGDNAFLSCEALRSITIPDSVVSIGNYAFSRCSTLQSVTIPNSITSIGKDAFYYCWSLKNIVIPNSVTSVGSEAFAYCTSLSSVTIPDSITTIEYSTFGYCSSLTNVTIPISVTSIGDRAFKNCDKITDFYYTGSKESWKLISIGIENYSIGNATIHYNYTPDSSGNASSGGATMLRTQSTGAIQTATFDDLVPNANYLFVVSKSSSLDDMLDADNLLFIDEKRTGDSGKLTFGYQPRENYEGATVLIFGPIANYDLNPNVVAGASKLYEPWGLMYFATFDGDDIAHVQDRGFAILKDTYYTEDMTPETLCADEHAHIFWGSKDELLYEEPSTKYPNGRYAATLTKGIYSYDISAKYYVVAFAKMDNGQVIYSSKVKSNSMEKILRNNLDKGTVSETEKEISRCILALKDTVAAHYEAMGIPSAAEDKAIPRGSSQTAAPSQKSMMESGITPNVVTGAARLIEPWGMRYFATFSESDDIQERGIVMLNEKNYQTVYSLQPDQMRLDAESYVFRTSDGSLEYEAEKDRYFATVTEGISSRSIAELYYVVPFVVTKDGSYVYGTVKSHSMKKIFTNNLNKTNVPDTEKALSRDILALYEAVKTYYGDA